MNAKLDAWARAVKARRRRAGLPDVPALWLFTDARRLPDPRAAIARLPRGLCGVILRHDGESGRTELAHDVAAICRVRRLALSVAGDWRLAASVHATCHFRDGWGRSRPSDRCTSSAHDAASLRRAARRGASPIFLSPWRVTASHPGTRTLGSVRWSRLALAAPSHPLCILGGVNGATARAIPPRAAGAGTIAALL